MFYRLCVLVYPVEDQYGQCVSRVAHSFLSYKKTVSSVLCCVLSGMATRNDTPPSPSATPVISRVLCCKMHFGKQSCLTNNNGTRRMLSLCHTNVMSGKDIRAI